MADNFLSFFMGEKKKKLKSQISGGQLQQNET